MLRFAIQAEPRVAGGPLVSVQLDRGDEALGGHLHEVELLTGFQFDKICNFLNSNAHLRFWILDDHIGDVDFPFRFLSSLTRFSR